MTSVLRRVAPPLAIAALLWWRGRPDAAVVVGVVVVVLIGAGVFAPDAAARLDRALSRAGGAVGHAVGRVLATVGWCLVVLPMWAVAAVVRLDPLRGGWGGGTSAYAGPPSSRGPDRRVHHPGRTSGPDLPAAPAVRRRRSMTAGTVVAALALVALVLVSGGRRPPGPEDAPGAVDLRATAAPATGPRDLGDVERLPDDQVRWAGLPVDDYAHADEPFAKDLFRELNATSPRSDPIVGARLVDVRGDHVNITDGRRETWQPGSTDVTVWYFGGSTMFGIGQRDDHTIPSVVAQLAQDDGIGITGLNFGVSADVNWVETLRFLEALGSDLPRPDLVVFYDGSNDQGVGFERVDAGRTDPAASSRLALSDEERERLAVGAPDLQLDPASRAALATELSAAQYRRGVRWARAAADAADVTVLHFWQPQPFAKEPSPADDELYRRLEFDRSLLPAARASYDAVRVRSEVDPIDLSRALDGTTEPVFFDGSHTNELGARIVATAMYQRLRPQLLEAVGR